MTVALLYQDQLKEYDFGSGHPFHGNRYELFMQFLQNRFSPDDHYQVLPADPASTEELLRICEEDYIEFSRE
jgi:acetoin utilization deacetylase AcuC-like enzyme